MSAVYGGAFSICRDLGKSLNEIMGWLGRMTWRQLVAYQEWSFEDLSVPSKTDRYLMQLMERLDRIWSTEPMRGFDANRWVVKVGRKADPIKPEKQKLMTKAELDLISRKMVESLFQTVGRGELKVVRGGHRDN